MSAVSGKELYAILGLDEKAGPEELRRAYLSLAVKYHPDRNPGDPAAEERFKDISQAYAILSDPECLRELHHKVWELDASSARQWGIT